MSNMFVGPAYATARALEERGLVTVQPIGYLNTALPFRSQTGIDEVVRFLCQDALDNGTPFPLGTSVGHVRILRRLDRHRPGAFMEHIRPEHGRAHHRLADLKRVIAFGDPLRGLNRCAPGCPTRPRQYPRYRPGLPGRPARLLAVALPARATCTAKTRTPKSD